MKASQDKISSRAYALDASRTRLFRTAVQTYMACMTAISSTTIVRLPDSLPQVQLPCHNSATQMATTVRFNPIASPLTPSKLRRNPYVTFSPKSRGNFLVSRVFARSHTPHCS